MTTLSIVILTYNSDEVLEDCLKSISEFGDEVVIIDSFSTDKTLSIAKKFHAKIYQNKQLSFSEQRNIGKSKSNSEWILYLDSDERVTEEFKKEVNQIISSHDNESNIAGYFVKRKTFYLNKDWGFQDKVQRLFIKDRLQEWYGKVHETPKVSGEFSEINTPILHFTHRSLEQMVEKTNMWSEIEAKLRYDTDHPKMFWWRFPRVMITGFLRSYIKEGSFKNGTEGLIESLFQAFSMFITYAKLWELQKKK